jgi:hypothetical protein
VEQYLKEFHEIVRKELGPDVEQVPEDLQMAVKDVWQRIHERRRGYRGGDDQLAALRLAKHDAENYLGVLGRRRRQTDTPFGYSTWWLTLDRGAYSVTRKLSIFHDQRGVASPALSPDFMVNYLVLGPMRARLGRTTEMTLPLVTDLTAVGLPTELLETADAVRSELSHLQPHVVDRRIRDALDAGRVQLGARADRGIEGVLDDLRRVVRRKATEQLPADVQEFPAKNDE